MGSYRHNTGCEVDDFLHISMLTFWVKQNKGLHWVLSLCTTPGGAIQIDHNVNDIPGNTHECPGRMRQSWVEQKCSQGCHLNPEAELLDLQTSQSLFWKHETSLKDWTRMEVFLSGDFCTLLCFTIFVVVLLPCCNPVEVWSGET